MDILNFISWIRGGRQVTSVDPDKTLVPIGIKDSRRDDGYLAAAITVTDLANYICDGGCNNCTPGTVALESTIPIPNLEFPCLDGIILTFTIFTLGCPGFVSNSGAMQSSISILGEVFDAQDVVDLINNSEIGQNYGIVASIIDDGLTFEISVDTCSCLGIYLNGGGAQLQIFLNLPA